ncbi:flagellar hook capping FlgD N-terminal domain-containing protein [Salipiger thiooxidans]|uniref:flagellar hook capping FlgD N-terminal domain-containing protein n=1 Tax=Salipiger thiooxidans TaxID=282683 RepID=UPI001CD564A4|nr:flagellar hook capping FlgD N-terminal domain-containing protein [Salipiger thiooxidans]MCA0846374.1 flagellin biosynthesis protein FlgD [Salipiger thiooxidans]
MQTGSVGAVNASISSSNTASTKKTVLSSDFETFLKMLTTQMQNQDPLNPLDTTEYATQLATFSSVEQQVLTNDLLKELTGVIGGDQFQELAGWIGKQALSDAPVFYGGAPIVLRPEYANGADSARLVVRDAGGSEVQTLALDMSDPVIAWVGVDDLGDPLPSGVYSFQIESLSGSGVIGRSDAQVYNPIIEVRQQNGEVMLTLSDGSEIRASDVTALRSGIA